MIKIALLCFLSIFSLSLYGKIWTVTNNGNSFVPQTLTVQKGDTINFNLESFHNAVEVSKSTWDANGNGKLNGGFDLAFGGGTLYTSTLQEGSYYYVCTPHAAMGMKGTIVISGIITSINTQGTELSIFPNPADDYIKIRTSNSIGTKYKIIDPTGRIVKSGQLTSDIELLDIKNLHSGIYFVQIANVETITMKFKKR